MSAPLGLLARSFLPSRVYRRREATPDDVHPRWTDIECQGPHPGTPVPVLPLVWHSSSLNLLGWRVLSFLSTLGAYLSACSSSFIRPFSDSLRVFLEQHYLLAEQGRRPAFVVPRQQCFDYCRRR